jgi:4-amino-4-deoxychorismate lyase
MITLINGQLQNTISVQDRGLAYGDGVFETMLSIHGQIPLLHKHMQRLHESLQRLDIQTNRIEENIELIHAHLLSDKQQIVKLTVTRGVGPRGYLPVKPCLPTVIIQISDKNNIDETKRRSGVSITYCETLYSKQPKLAGMKHLNRMDQVLAQMELAQGPFDEGIMFDDKQCAISATMHNLFLVNASCLITPKLDECGVAGVMRAHVLDLANQLNLDINVQTVTKNHINQADELFLTNSLHGIWPICQLNSTILPIGPVTSELMNKVAKVIPYGD